jgi:hypothetical protein
MSPTEPLDELHAACISLRDEIREAFEVLQSRAAVWEPDPCPADWSVFAGRQHGCFQTVTPSTGSWFR